MAIDIPFEAPNDSASITTPTECPALEEEAAVCSPKGTPRKRTLDPQRAPFDTSVEPNPENSKDTIDALAPTPKSPKSSPESPELLKAATEVLNAAPSHEDESSPQNVDESSTQSTRGQSTPPPPQNQNQNRGDGIRTLWCGDLAQWMDEVFLYHSFTHTGEVVNTKVIRNKSHPSVSEGYGFVEFTNHEAADRILKAWNGTPIPNTTQCWRLNWATYGIGDRREGHQGGEEEAPAAEFSIFVGDLGSAVTDVELLDVFKKQYPSTKSAKVILDTVSGRTKGYGFVRFGSEEERDRAMKEMNGEPCAARPMRISAATAKKGMGSDGDGDFTASSESVPYGGYRGNRIRYARQSHGHKGMHAYHNPGAYASVRNSVFNTGGVGGGGGGGAGGGGDSNTNSSILAMSSALEHSSLSGGQSSRVVSSHAFSRPAPAPPPIHASYAFSAAAVDSPENTTVFVGGLDNAVPETTLRNAFGAFGELVYVKIPQGKGCGFVQFVHRVSAQRAMAALQGKKIGNSQIRLSWGRNSTGSKGSSPSGSGPGSSSSSLSGHPPMASPPPQAAMQQPTNTPIQSSPSPLRPGGVTMPTTMPYSYGYYPYQHHHPEPMYSAAGYYPSVNGGYPTPYYYAVSSEQAYPSQQQAYYAPAPYMSYVPQQHVAPPVHSFEMTQPDSSQ